MPTGGFLVVHAPSSTVFPDDLYCDEYTITFKNSTTVKLSLPTGHDSTFDIKFYLEKIRNPRSFRPSEAFII